MQSGPTTPAQLTPGDGASVTVPLKLSWSASSDPSGIAGYNWEISASPAFSTLVQRDSTGGAVTEQTVGGLPSGTYYWRVQAASNAFVQGAWSATRSFVVTGSSPNAIGSPVLAPLPFGGAQYHPMESFAFSWSAVPGASTYVVEADRRAGFPAPVEVKFDNITTTSSGLTFHSSLQGNWNLRVVALDANGVRGIPSNVRTFSVNFNAPIGPPPTLASPAAGATLELPITIDWNDVENPQSSGYEAQVATDPGFSNVEVQISGQTSSQYQLLSLTPGTKYWRVRHAEGDSSPTTAAVTAWSEVRSFTVSAAAAKIASIALGRASAFSGQEQVVDVQLSAAAPPGGAVVELSSTHPGATPLPATVTVPAGFAFTQFRFFYGQVTQPTDATITARLGGSTATAPITVNPPGLKALDLSPLSVTGGSSTTAWIELNGFAPPGGLTVSLSSSSPLARVPATATVPAGNLRSAVNVDTSEVQGDTPVTITATYKGQEQRATLTLQPAVPPDSLTIDPATTVANQGSSGVVRLASPATRDTQINLKSSHPAIAGVPASVTIPIHSPHAGFTINTTKPATTTVVTITASAGGVSRTATLTVQPVAPTPPPPLAAPTLATPANAAAFARNQSIPFDWSDVSGAASYQIQVATSTSFVGLFLDQVVTASQLSTAFDSTGNRAWRVRALDAGGNPGAWSTARTFSLS
jgi:predicted secreted protein